MYKSSNREQMLDLMVVQYYDRVTTEERGLKISSPLHYVLDPKRPYLQKWYYAGHI
jgi:hypothetical protein